MKRSIKPKTTIDDIFIDSQIKSLLTNEKNFRPNLKNQEGNTALIITTHKGDVKKMKLFLQKENPNIVDRNGDSPLIIAVNNKNEKAVKLLLNPKYKVNLDQVQKYTGFTAIYFATIVPFLGQIKESQIKILKMLLDSGANPNIRYADSNNSSPLLTAVNQENLSIIKCLLNPKYKVDLYSSDEEAISSLGYSIIYNRPLIVELLLKKGVDPNIGCFGSADSNKSALVYSIKNNNTEIIKLLLKHGANPTGQFFRFENYDDTKSPLKMITNFKTPFDAIINDNNDNKESKIEKIISYLQIVCGQDMNINNSINTFLRNKDFEKEKSRVTINTILTNLIQDCEMHNNLLYNLHLFEKSKEKNTKKSFMKTLRANIIDSDRIIPMNILSYLDGGKKRKSKRIYKRKY